MLSLVALAEDYATTASDAQVDAAAGAVVAGFGAFMLFFIVIALILGVFTIWMFIDALIRSDEDYEKIGSGSKIIWALLIFFLGFIPAIIYFFVIRKKSKAFVAPAAAAPAAK